MEKNDFAEISKNFARYKSENNFVELSKLLCRMSSSINGDAQNFDVLATSLKILHNYFGGLIKFRSIYLNFYFSKIVSCTQDFTLDLFVASLKNCLP